MESTTGERGYEDFVEDMFSSGKRYWQVLAVAKNTRWRSKINEIEVYAQKFLKKFKKLGQRPNSCCDNMNSKALS